MTEQKYMQNFVRQNVKTWVAAVILGAVIGVLGASQFQTNYQGSVTFQVSRATGVSQQSVDYYVYDGFYNQQAALLARNNFVSWITSVRSIYDVYKAAGLEQSVTSAEDISGHLKITETAPSTTVSVVYKRPLQVEAEKLGASLVEVGTKYTMDNVHITASDPLVVAIEPKKTLIALAITLAVTLAAFFVTLLTHYFRAEN